MNPHTTETALRASDTPKKLLHGYAEERDVATELGIHIRTLRRMPNGPPYVVVARKRRYPIELFQKWLAKRVRAA
jgi:hypothetical protein